MRNQICKLRTKTVSGSEITWHEKEVFCGEKSIVASEFYASYNVGLKLEYSLDVDPYDFEEAYQEGEAPSEVEYKKKIYILVRTYKPNETSMELKIGVKL